MLFCANAFALPLHPHHKPHFNFTQLGTLDACGVYANRRDSIGCNPANFSNSAYEGLVFYLATKTDGDSVEVGKNLLFEPITESTLRDIFELNSFSSWEANTMIEFRTKIFYLSYDPIYASTSFYLYNPAFPEVSLNISSQRRLNMTTGSDIVFDGKHKLSFGGNVFYYERYEYAGAFALFDVSSQGTDELIDLEKSNSIEMDLGLIYKITDLNWFPKFSFLVRNLGADAEVDEKVVNSETLIENLMLYETYSKLDIGYDFNLSLGSVGASLSLPFEGYYTNLYTDYTAFSLSYSLWDFEVMSGLSKYSQTIAVKFASSGNSIGVYFGKSKNLGDFIDIDEKFAGVSLEIFL